MFWIQSSFQVTKQKQTCQIKMLYREQTFAPRAFHSQLQQQTNTINTQKCAPWACNKGCAEACAERFSALKSGSGLGSRPEWQLKWLLPNCPFLLPIYLGCDYKSEGEFYIRSRVYVGLFLTLSSENNKRMLKIVYYLKYGMNWTAIVFLLWRISTLC